MKKFVTLFVVVLFFLGLNSQPLTRADTIFPPEADRHNAMFFGSDFEIYGNYMVVGAKYSNKVATKAGAAYVYEFVNNQWQLDTVLYPTAADNTDAYFGTKVAISGVYMAVFASGENSGTVYTYKLVNGQWQSIGKIVPGKWVSDIALNFTELALGCPYTTVGGENAAGMFIGYYFDGSQWSDGDTVETPVPDYCSYFGMNMFYKEGWLFVPDDLGNVFVYTFSKDDGFLLNKTISPPQNYTVQFYSLDMYDNLLVMGDRYYNGKDGIVFAYDFLSDKYLDTLQMGTGSYNYYGYLVAINENKELAVIRGDGPTLDRAQLLYYKLEKTGYEYQDYKYLTLQGKDLRHKFTAMDYSSFYLLTSDALARFRDADGNILYDSLGAVFVFDARPIIETQPENKLALCWQDLVTLSVAGKNISTAQWYVSYDRGQTFSPVQDDTTFSFAKTSSMTVKINNSLLDSALFYCVVTNQGFAVNSDTVKLTIEKDPPILSLQSQTVSLGESGVADFDQETVISSIFETCSVVDTVFWGVPATFTCDDADSAYYVKVKVTDNAGNYTVDSAKVEIRDDVAPSYTVNSITVYLDQNGQVDLYDYKDQIVTDIVDNCSNSTYFDPSTLSCSDTGQRNIFVTVYDTRNYTDKDVIITVKDTTPPSFTVEAPTGYLDGDGVIVEPVFRFYSDMSDNCTYSYYMNVTVSKTTFTCQDLGETTVTVTAKDRSGNTTVKTTTYTLYDTIKPRIITSSEINLVANTAGGYKVAGGEIDLDSVWDNCSCMDTVNDFNNASSLKGATLPLGTTEIEWTVSDCSGNTATKKVTVTVTEQSLTGIYSLDGHIKIYPNPANDKVFIRIKDDRQYSVTVMDIDGRSIKQYTVDRFGNVIDISALAPGVYLFKVSDGEKSMLKRIVKL